MRKHENPGKRDGGCTGLTGVAIAFSVSREKGIVCIRGGMKIRRTENRYTPVS
ncbi:hypothetical protein NB646_04545 [Oxalobacter aliiformigenes]|uniref:Uncharacterized protein n=1 Tax=Oxalobacter aliiformigenes TaxID=2946593 RepID=A0A9E9LFC1_9BURK|nr:hypothetical protein [Oxalobacter aliiformigenes]WAV91992.1 hypothetical protein NB646_04545 [Oxalobacter aliiformigenes]WAV94398.1 hypothetical protein NB643_05990 [Oxalobacter aliiformigenes]